MMSDAAFDSDKIRTRLEAWLATRLPALGNLRVTAIDHPASAGVASETLLIGTATADAEGPGLVVRLARDIDLYPDSDLELHAHMYARVGESGMVPVPQVHAVENDRSVLGHPFMVVERLTGRAPPDRPNFNFHGWLHDMPTAERAALWQGAVTVMGALHSLENDRFPLLQRRMRARDGLRDNLDYWMRYASWCGALSLPLMRKAADWLNENLPIRDPTTQTLSWGDARMQNLLFEGSRCTGLLDWDMVSLAGAEADLAWWALADHKNTASRGKLRLSGLGSPAETIRLWESMTGRKALNMDWHLIFASFRQASIGVRLAAMSAEKTPDFNDAAYAPIGMQWISCLLGIPLRGEITQPFVGLER